MMEEIKILVDLIDKKALANENNWWFLIIEQARDGLL